MKQTSVWMAAVTLLLAGPAAAGEDGPTMLQDLVRERTGVALRWTPGGREESAAADTIRALLQGELTADRAVRVALLNHRGLRASFEEIGISLADYRQALLPRNPVLDGETRSGAGARRPGELGVMQDLNSILLALLRRQAAGAAMRRASLRAADAALEVVREARVAFYHVQAAEQLRRFLERTAAAAQAAADLARRQHQAGNIADVDLESHQALYEQARVELLRGETEALAARERLNRAMGVWGEQAGWEVVGDLPEVPADTATLAGLESVAIARRLDLAAAEAEVQGLAKAVPLARYSRFPALRAGVHLEREPEGTRTTGPAVELAFPLFDRGQHAVARARAQLRQAQDRHAALAVEIRSEVRASGYRMAAARELVGYYRDIVLPRRERIVEQTQREYNFMLAGVYQLLEAKQGEIRAEHEYLEAQRDYWIARAELERAVGGPLAATSPN